MFRRMVLIVLMSVLLTGARAASTPLPVLFMMGCLIIFAAIVSARREQQG